MVVPSMNWRVRSRPTPLGAAMSWEFSIALVAVAALRCPIAQGLPVVRNNDLEFQGVDAIAWTETMHAISDGQPRRLQ